MKVVSPTSREARRLQAWKLHRQGWSPARHRRLVGGQRFKREPLAATRPSGGWVQGVASPEGSRGRQAFAVRPLAAATRPCCGRGAEAHGFRGALWNRPRVAVLIKREFGVTYSPRHVGRLLAAMNWSVQRPLRRARQRNEEKIARWRTERWPTLQAKPNA